MPAPPENLMHMPLPRTDRKLPRHTLQSAMADRHKIMQERSRGNRNYENEDIRNNEQDEAQHRKCFFFSMAIRPDSGSWPPLKGLRDHTHWTHHTR